MSEPSTAESRPFALPPLDHEREVTLTLTVPTVPERTETRELSGQTGTATATIRSTATVEWDLTLDAETVAEWLGTSWDNHVEPRANSLAPYYESAPNLSEYRLALSEAAVAVDDPIGRRADPGPDIVRRAAAHLANELASADVTSRFFGRYTPLDILVAVTRQEPVHGDPTHPTHFPTRETAREAVTDHVE